MSSTTATYLDLKDELIAGFPPGTEDVIDWDDPNGPGPLMEAIGHVLEDHGTASVDALRLELSPLTCSPAGIALWEQGLGLSQTRTAISGATEQRRSAMLAKLRERGAPTKTLIQTILNGSLLYGDQSQIVILESNRAQLRAAATLTAGGGALSTTPLTIPFYVRDDPRVSPAGVQVDLFLSLSDLSKLTVTLFGPDYSTQYAPGSIGVGPSLSPWTTRALWGVGTFPVFAVGDGGVAYLFDGTNWTQPLPTGTSETLRALWGLTASPHTLAVGDGGTILLWDNIAWTPQASGTTSNLYGVWGSASNNVWAVGAGGTALFWDGSTWATESSGTTQDLLAIWGTDASHIWAVGAGGTIKFWNGAIWSTQASGVTVPLRGVWGADTSHVWAVGDGGTILFWDGTAWAAQTSGTAAHLNAVWGTSTSNVYAVGDGGTILLFTTNWVPLVSGTIAPLYGVWGSSSGDVWAGGDTILLHLQTGTWSPIGAVRLYFPAFAGHEIFGAWTLSVELSSGAGILTRAELFVEGLGRYFDFLGQPQDGLGAAMYQWGVVVDDSLLGAGYDLYAAANSIAHLNYARSQGALIRRPAGQLAAIPDDPHSIPDACVPG